MLETARALDIVVSPPGADFIPGGKLLPVILIAVIAATALLIRKFGKKK